MKRRWVYVAVGVVAGIGIGAAATLGGIWVFSGPKRIGHR